MPYFIIEACTRCGECAEVCPVECIVPGPGDATWPTFYIDPETCIDCGACVPECPVEAIYGEEEELPIEYEDGQWANAAFFAEGPGYGALGDEEVTRWWE